VPLGVVLIACTLLYTHPAHRRGRRDPAHRATSAGPSRRTCAWGSLFSHVLFPIYFGAMLWGGLYLRDEKVRQLVPL
jgi:hypothetical protein